MELDLEQFKKDFAKVPKYKIIQGVLRKSHLNNVNVNSKSLAKLPFRFNVSLPEKVNATNQEISGRCWLFAGLNLLRHKLIAKHKLEPDFQLSQAHLFRYDKLEKCNTALEVMYRFFTKEHYAEGSLEHIHLIPNLIGDGGTWPMFVNLVEKYGVMPQEVFPDNAQVTNTGKLNSMLHMIIMKVADNLKESTSRTDFNIIKRNTLSECYRIINMFVGEEPDEFVWSWNTKTEKQLTAVQFYKTYVVPLINVKDYVYICNYPVEKYNQVIAVEFLHNVIEDGDDIKHKPTNVYFNVDIDVFKNAVFKTINVHKSAVWFACDIGQFLLNRGSILDQKASNMKEMFDIDFQLSNRASLETRTNVPNHAMCFVGCHKTDDGKFERWKVENSHGEYGELKGFITMSDSWFDDFVICAAVHIDSLPVALRKTAKDHRHIKWLPFYCPLGVFA